MVVGGCRLSRPCPSVSSLPFCISVGPKSCACACPCCPAHKQHRQSQCTSSNLTCAESKSSSPQHVALICQSLEAALSFYEGTLGLELNSGRPDTKLPYRGAWLTIGSEMLHLLELPIADPAAIDRVLPIAVPDLTAVEARLRAQAIPFTSSDLGEGRTLILRDPEGHCVTLTQAVGRP